MFLDGFSRESKRYLWENQMVKKKERKKEERKKERKKERKERKKEEGKKESHQHHNIVEYKNNI